MEATRQEFSDLVVSVLARWFAQNGQTAPAPAAWSGLADRLAGVIAERGLPRPLAVGEAGAPGGLPEAEVLALTTRVAGEGAGPLLADAAKQLVKACFYPEFTVCRDSFREVSRDGSCRRQELERVRGRISGSHCVDCPHWVGGDPAQHREFFAREWRGEPRMLAAHEAVFLPQDFGALRRWLHAAARRPRPADLG